MPSKKLILHNALCVDLQQSTCIWNSIQNLHIFNCKHSDRDFRIKMRDIIVDIWEAFMKIIHMSVRLFYCSTKPSETHFPWLTLLQFCNEHVRYLPNRFPTNSFLEKKTGIGNHLSIVSNKKDIDRIWKFWRFSCDPTITSNGHKNSKENNSAARQRGTYMHNKSVSVHFNKSLN